VYEDEKRMLETTIGECDAQLVVDLTTAVFQSIAFFSSSHLYIALQNQQELEKKQEQDEKLLSPCHWLVEGRGNDTLQWA